MFDKRDASGAADLDPRVRLRTNGIRFVQ